MGFVLGAAGEDDGADAPDAVEEAGLEAAEGEELALGSGGCADARGGHGDGDQESAEEEHTGGDRVSPERSNSDQSGCGDGQGRGGDPAGEQTLQSLDAIDGDGGEFGGMLAAEQGGTGCEDAGQNLGAQAAAPGGARPHRGMFHRPDEGGAGEGEQGEGDEGWRWGAVTGEDG